MANACWYSLRVVSPTKEAIDRLLSIMQYKDSDYFIYRVFSAEYDDEPVKGDDDLWTAVIVGDVAWGLSMWCKGFTSKDERNSHMADTEVQYRSFGDPQYRSLNDICKEFGIGIEVWGAEPDSGIQQHFILNNKGDICMAEEVDWEPGENGLDPHIGGFGKRYETWVDNSFYNVRKN